MVFAGVMVKRYARGGTCARFSEAKWLRNRVKVAKTDREPFWDSRRLWYTSTNKLSAQQGRRHGARSRSLGGISVICTREETCGKHQGFFSRLGVKRMSVKVMGIKEIEKAIVQLPAKDLDKLAGWLEDYRAQMWDKQIEEDLAAGHLDALLAEVDEEYEAGLSQPL